MKSILQKFSQTVSGRLSDLDRINHRVSFMLFISVVKIECIRCTLSEFVILEVEEQLEYLEKPPYSASNAVFVVIAFS